MLFHVLTTVVSPAVPGVAATLMTLRVCAVENACASSCELNTDGENTDGENTLGLNTDGENTLGLNTDGENTLGLNTDGENTLGLNTDGLNASGLNTDGENTLGLNTDGAYSAVSLSRSVVLALAGLNCFANAWPMSLNTAMS